MTAQRALLVKEIGKPLVLVHDRLIPKEGPGQVQIKVTVAGKSQTRRNMAALSFFGFLLLRLYSHNKLGLNPHDQRSRDTGLLIEDKLPAVLSKDVVGTVSQVGDGVTNLRVGDRVMSLGSGAVTDSSQSGFPAVRAC